MSLQPGEYQTPVLGNFEHICAFCILKCSSDGTLSLWSTCPHMLSPKHDQGFLFADNLAALWCGSGHLRTTLLSIRAQPAERYRGGAGSL